MGRQDIYAGFVQALPNYFDHLMADPSTNPIQLPDLVEIGRTLQTLLAGMVIAFDPDYTGEPLLRAGTMPAYLPAALDYPGIVKSIGDLMARK